MYNWIFCSCLYLQSNITWFWALLINIFILLFPGVCFPSNFSRWSTDTWKDISVNIAVRYPVNADTAVPGSCEFHRECACKHHQDCRVSWSRWSRQQTPSFAAGTCWSLHLPHTHTIITAGASWSLHLPHALTIITAGASWSLHLPHALTIITAGACWSLHLPHALTIITAYACWSLHLQHTHHRNSHFPHESGLAEVAVESLHRDVYGPNWHC